MAALEKYHTTYNFPGLDTFRQWSAAGAIEAMDKGGVANAVLSTTTPGIWFGDDAQARGLARDMNDFGARLVADHKDRFGLFAVLPLPDVEASLREIEYGFDTLEGRRHRQCCRASRHEIMGWATRPSRRSGRSSTGARRSCSATPPRPIAARA